jgi:hypothetical protein
VTLGHFKINPTLHKVIMIFLCIMTLLIGITAQPKTSEAIFPFLIPLAAMTASEYLVVGSLAVASGLIFANPEATEAVIQDMYRKGVDLFDTAISTMVDGNIYIDQALANFLMTYALEDATTFDGVTLQYAVTSAAGTIAWDTTRADGALVENDMAIYTRDSSGNKVIQTGRWNDNLTSNLTEESISQPYQKNLILHFNPGDGTSVDLGSQTINGMMLHGYDNNFSETWDYKLQIAFVNSAGTNVSGWLNIDYTQGEYVEFPTAYTDILYLNIAGNTDGNNLWHWSEMEFFTKPMQGTEILETVITAPDISVDLEWAKPNDLTGVNVATPATAGSTTADAITALQGITAAEMTLTDVATGNPYTPKLPPSGNPQLPWYFFFVYFLDMLRAMIEYTVRLVAFVVTLQGVSARGVGEYSEIYSWFRNTSFAGINIYSIVMSLAAFSVSLMIYRVVKRV